MGEIRKISYEKSGNTIIVHNPDGTMNYVTESLAPRRYGELLNEFEKQRRREQDVA